MLTCVRSSVEAPNILKCIRDFMLRTKGAPYTEGELLEKWPVINLVGAQPLPRAPPKTTTAANSRRSKYV